MNWLSIQQSWRRAKARGAGVLLISVLLHAALLVLLCVAAVRTPPPVYTEQLGPPVPMIQARAITAAQVERGLQLRQQKIAAAKLAQRRALAAKRRALAAKRAAEQARVRALKIAKAKALFQQKARESLAAQLAREQARLVQQKQALLAKQQREQAAAELAQRQRQRQAGVVNEYIARIKNAVQLNWHYPPGTDSNLTSKIQVTLAPGGAVLSVVLLRSSGNVAMDRSAERAIWLTSPLPVPQNPALFDNLRQFSFTMQPKQV